MKTLLSVLPEIVFTAGTATALLGMWYMMGWEYVAFFGGAILILISAYLHNVMHVEVADE